VPTRFYGKALPNSVVKISFNGIDKTITIGAGESQWEATFPAMPASAEAKMLHASCTLDGVLMHQRTVVGLVVGDVWYVAPQDAQMPRYKGWPNPEPPTGNVRMFMSTGWIRFHIAYMAFCVHTYGCRISCPITIEPRTIV